MVNYNLNRYISVIVIIAILAFVVCLLCNISLWNSISYSVSATAVVVCLFINFLWKCPLFRGWLVPFPNLNGRWEGNIKSLYKNTTKEIPIKLDIKQTFLHIQIKCYTEESKSNSIVASFNIDKDRDILQLCYSYQNDPKATFLKKSPMHYGSVILNINEKHNQMEGHYWTTRNTLGEIYINRI